MSAALTLSACAADEPAQPGSGGSGGATASGPVSTRDLPGIGTVLVDSGGRTVYFTDTDQPGSIKCTADCLELWHPVMAPDAGLTDAPVADLGTVSRPEGTNQITYQNKPLYTFALDGPDKPASGDNATDSFGGVEFTWHAAKVSGGGQAPPPSNDGGYGGGRY